MALHQDISDKLRKAICLGRLVPGEKLPPEPDLASQLGVSRKTLRVALADLEESGIILRRKRGGTSIAPDASAKLRVKFRFGYACRLTGATLPVTIGFHDKSPVSRLGSRLLGKGAEIRMIDGGTPEVPAGLDGVILGNPMHYLPLQKTLAEKRIPHVGFELHPGFPGCCTVSADDRAAARQCVRDLAERGFRRIAFIGGRLGDPAVPTGIRRRTEGFLAECAALDLPIQEQAVFNLEQQDESSELLYELPKRIAGCDAVVCALGQSILELERLRLICGARLIPALEVRGVDLHPFDHPELWAQLERYRGFCKPHEALAETAEKLLLCFLAEPDFVPEEVKLPYEENICDNRR